MSVYKVWRSREGALHLISFALVSSLQLGRYVCFFGHVLMSSRSPSPCVDFKPTLSRLMVPGVMLAIHHYPNTVIGGGGRVGDVQYCMLEQNLLYPLLLSLQLCFGQL